MDFHTIIGSVGVAMLLLAYVLLQLKKLDTKNLSYAVLNLLGAVMAMWSSYIIDFIPFVVLEGTWALVSLHMIWKFLLSLKLKNFKLIKIFSEKDK